MLATFLNRPAAFLCLIIGAPICGFTATTASTDDLETDDTREIRITNGDPISPQQFPFLTAVLTGREAEVQLGSSQIPAFFFGGIEPIQFFGEVVECGLALSPCSGVDEKVCSIVLDFPTEDAPAKTPSRQLENCRLGGGIGAIFRAGTARGSFDLAGPASTIPAVYLPGFEGAQQLRNALIQGFDTTINVLPNVPDEILCGGVFLGREWVLTAAHCVVDERGEQRRLVEPYELLVSVGAHDLTDRNLQIQRVVEVITNNYYTNGPWGVNDYALLRLDEPLSDREGVVPVTRDELDSLAAMAAPAQIAGWGSTRVREPLAPIDFSNSATTDLPLTAALTLHTVQSCANLWRDFFLLNNLDSLGLSISNHHICASNPEYQRDSCQGDSGGPLLVNSNGSVKLAGITNFGLGCGGSNSVPGVYASLPSFSDWIVNVTGLAFADTVDRSAFNLSGEDVDASAALTGTGSFRGTLVAAMLVLLALRRRHGRPDCCDLKA